MFDIYKGKRILVTGSAGFCGSWLCRWLSNLGAEVVEYGHPPRDTPNHYELLGGVKSNIVDYISLREPVILRPHDDLLSYSHLLDVIKFNRPDLIIHLAAKGIVARTLTEPHETFENNIMGALNILEAYRLNKSVKGMVMVATDKVYSIKGQKAYREDDELGGIDPYSCSKVCVEHITKSYREHFGLNIAVARAGNTIGGGDFTYKRLIPDIVKATIKGEKVVIRTPNATRPFQHVLEALHGYLLLGQHILEGKDVNRAWNFGPNEGDMTVHEVLLTAQTIWPKVGWEIDTAQSHPAMDYLLNIDSTDAKTMLGWKPVWSIKEAVERTIGWYEAYYEKGVINTDKDIEDFENGLHSRS